MNQLKTHLFIRRRSSRLIGVVLLLSPATSCLASLTWVQNGGSSGTSGAGSHVNSYVASGGSNGAVNFVSSGTLLSYGSVSDGVNTLDYAVTFQGGENPLFQDMVGNSFAVHADGTADFYSSSHLKYGHSSQAGTTFADNGSATLSISFFGLNTFDPMSGSGTPYSAQLSLTAINNSPSAVGGTAITTLNTNEFHDVGWGGGGGTALETDPSDQIVLDTTPGATTLTNYATASAFRPIGSTGATDPGTGGITDPLTLDLRVEHNVSHNVGSAAWSVELPETHTYTISRTGDMGQRSGIGFGGDLGVVTPIPEPSTTILSTLCLVGLLLRRRRSQAWKV